jgi:hypothetical protein
MYATLTKPLRGLQMAKAKAVKGNKASKGNNAKQVNAVSIAPVAVATPAPVVPTVVTTVASVATKLTKRNSTPLNAVLVATNKVNRNRAPHVQAAWQAVVAALPATATQLATLPALAHPQCVSPQAFLSYMLRRGHLAIQGQ